MHPSTPKYIQLIEIIKDAIQQQTLLPQQKLPNEDDLAAQYGMSRGTVRKAIAELQRMGLVRKEQGRGTFVNEPGPALDGFSLVEFDHYMKAQNRVPHTETLTFEVIAATEFLADRLKIVSGTDTFHIVQLRLASGTPIVYEERYFAQSLCPGLTADLLGRHPLHWLLVEKYQIPLVRLTHTIERNQLPDEMCKLFQMTESAPVFRVDRLSYTNMNDVIQPAVWYQAFYRADEYQFHAQFHTLI